MELIRFYNSAIEAFENEISEDFGEVNTLIAKMFLGIVNHSDEAELIDILNEMAACHGRIAGSVFRITSLKESAEQVMGDGV